MDLTRDAMCKVEELVKKSYTVDVNGDMYSSCDLKKVVFNPLACSIELSSLSGLTEYMNKELIDDKKKGVDYFIHVIDPKNVEVLSNVHGDDRKRENIINCCLDGNLKEFPFGSYLSQEDFIIKVQTLLKETKDREYLKQYAMAVRVDATVRTDDDGISQKVEQKSGISGNLTKEVDIKPVVSLKPFRTFREVEQPESQFLFRVRQVSGRPEFAIFEADGGVWRLEAVTNVVRYLQENIHNEQMSVIS